MLKWFGTILPAFVVLFSACSQDPSPPRTPIEELESMQIVDGLEISLVASEPLIQDPVYMTFDEDGRIWAVEMRGFNPNIDGEGEDAPIGKIVVLMDENDDGTMDRRTVFMDSLILPRSLAIVKDGVLVAERIPLWYVQDLDGDLIADKKVMVDSTYGGRGMPEHSPNGLWRGIDNWYYNAKSTIRYQMVDGLWVKDTTEFRGQWGISHDDYGRLYYNYNWSQLHADLVPPNYFNRNPHHETTTGIDHGLTLDRSVFPIRDNPAVNRGYIEGTLDEEGKLLEFTSACSPWVYRGTALPDYYRGNVFVCEPAGNLIKYNQVTSSGFMLSAHAGFNQREFLAATDERFRPVALTGGPDGALYVVDMYRGLIQHGIYMTPYLKEQTLERNLVFPIHMGRIWKIAGEGNAHQRFEALSTKPESEWVPLLKHSDGWYRDVAQRLLVDYGSEQIISALEDMVLNDENHLARLHALWTLHGMSASRGAILQLAWKDHHEQVRAAALRISEDLAREKGKFALALRQHIAFTWQREHPVVVLQMVLTLGNLPVDGKEAIWQEVLSDWGHDPVMRDAVMSGMKDRTYAFARQLLLQEDEERIKDQRILLEMLAQALGKKSDPQELQQLLEDLIRVSPDLQASVLSGLTMSMAQRTESLRLTREPSLFRLIAMEDSLVGDHLKRLKQQLSWPGNETGTKVEASGSSLTQEEMALFSLGRKHYLSACATCHGNDGSGLRRFAPPLRGSEWVLGDEKQLALILLHGIEGPIEVKGHTYEAPEILPVMPAHSILDDKELAAIMTYIRNEWGHSAGSVAPRTVGGIRHTSQGRIQPWNVADIKVHMERTADD